MLLLLRGLLDTGTVVPPPVIEPARNVYGSGRHSKPGHDPLIDQVLDKWEVIEAVQRKPVATPEPAPVPVIPEVIAFEDVPETSTGPTPQMAGAASVKPLDVTQALSLGAPLLPSAELLIRDAIERDDEEALIMILMQL